ncbi:MAG: type II toxin-antitoxin system RelE/ParE family toxin [Methyloceanibacter sp.]
MRSRQESRLRSRTSRPLLSPVARPTHRVYAYTIVRCAYPVFYRVYQDEVVILRIMHTARNP